jgi:flavodoxin
MKKTILIMFSIIMLVCVLAGCNSSTGGNIADSSQAKTENVSTNSESSKTLVVYYSASGNTKAVADTIANTLNTDIFEIVPTEIYSDADLNWTDKNSRVSKEYADESLRSVKLVSTTAPNWDKYDTVFIGYPIWWGIAAWPVDTFVESNNFAGKTVIPFCTSTSSGLGQSGELLAKLAGTGDWQKGIRFRSGVSSEDVSSWSKEVLGN